MIVQNKDIILEVENLECRKNCSLNIKENVIYFIKEMNNKTNYKIQPFSEDRDHLRFLYNDEIMLTLPLKKKKKEQHFLWLCIRLKKKYSPKAQEAILKVFPNKNSGTKNTRTYFKFEKWKDIKSVDKLINVLVENQLE
ncbi:MAG: hypothetical protein WCH65_05265 [bacterium]